jgi:hypothetical protein
MIKVCYQPFGLLFSVLGGVLAGMIFKCTWSAIAGEADTPDAKDQHRGWGEIIGAAAIQGAVFGTVKAAVDRAGAKGFERATGAWPGNTSVAGEG